MTNPLLENSYTVPDFDAIKPEHFEPAYEKIITEIRETAEEIRQQDALPAFENTAGPLESLFLDLSRVAKIYHTFYLNKSGKQIEDLAQPLSLRSDAIEKEIFQDPVLAERFKTVYDNRDSLGLDEQQQRVLENLHRAFEDNGTFLSGDDKRALNRIDEDLIAHCDTFSLNVRAAANQQAFLIADQELAGIPDDVRDSMRDNAAKALAGTRPGAADDDREFAEELSEDVIDALKQMEQEGTLESAFLFKPERLMVDTLLEIAESRSFRQKMFESLNNIGTQEPCSNEAPLREIQRLRQERVALLNKGRAPDEQFDNYTDRALSKTMAENFANVDALFSSMEKPLLEKFEADIRTLEEFSSAKGQTEVLEPWDIPYWANSYKKETWNFDSAAMAAYFETDNVVQGFLGHSAKLFGLEFKENKSHSAIHPDVKSYDVLDAQSGELIGILQMDLYARTGKRGGAWAMTTQNQDDGRPVMGQMNCNLAKPGKNDPSLMSADQVETLFHEGGHALNQILGTRSRYVTLHGTAHPSDFVENHSMVQENWAFQPEVLATYANHYDTGETLPEELLTAKEESDAFMQSRQPLLLIQNSRRDFLFHNTDPADYQDTQDIHDKARLDSDYAEFIRPYALTRFDHLFSSPSSSYAAGYYSYLWADSCAADIFSFFEREGLYDAEKAQALREFYEDGASRKPAQSFENFAGRSPSPAALLKSLGIAEQRDDGPDNRWSGRIHFIL